MVLSLFWSREIPRPIQQQEPSGEAWTSSSALFSPSSSVSIMFKKESSDGICDSTMNTLRLVKQCGRKYKNSFCSSWYSLRAAKKINQENRWNNSGKDKKGPHEDILK